MDGREHPAGARGRDRGSMDEDQPRTSEAKTLAAARDPDIRDHRLHLATTTRIQAGRGQSGRAASA
jgi:hypothetical protein